MEQNKSKCLVDWSGFGKTLGDVQGKFSLLEFLDYCTILEGITIYDELLLVNVPEISSPVKEKWSQNFNILRKSNVLSDTTIMATPALIGNQPERNSDFRYLKNKNYPNGTRTSLVDSWYEAGRLLGAESKTGIPSLPLLRQRPVYEKYAKVNEEHTYCSLIAQHKDLSHALQELRKNTRLKLKPLFIVPIPPIPLLVLERSRKKEDFLKVALELREEFSELRNSLTELRNVIYDNDISLIEKQKYRISWEKIWGTLGKYKDSHYSIDLADATKDKINIESSLDGIGLDSLNLTKLLEKAIKESSNIFHQRKIRMLHKAAKSYITASDGDMNRLIYKFYNQEVTKQDFEMLSDFGISYDTNV